MADDAESLCWWQNEILPFVNELHRLDAVHLETRVAPFPNNVCTCADIWLHGGVTFLDFVGNRVAGVPVYGVPHGVPVRPVPDMEGRGFC